MTSDNHPLSVDQKKKLRTVLKEEITIHPDAAFNLPSVRIQPVSLLLTLQRRLQEEGRVSVSSFRLNGSAAAYVIAGSTPDYNDLDLIVNVDLEGPDDLDYLREQLILSFASVAEERSQIKLERKTFVLARTYIRKMIKVNQGDGPEHDLWSMIALRNARGRNVEVKFVARLKRQFEFSVDSFQVLLNDFMAYCGQNEDAPLSECPEIYAQSVWGAFDEACAHYKAKLICTDNPEAIFGGGLLKYCRLRCFGYLPIGSHEETQQLERYMCCRFFIDVPRPCKVEDRIRSYLVTHFGEHPEQVHLFLQLLYDVVHRSSQCLMGKDRTQSLAVIAQLVTHCQLVSLPGRSRLVPVMCPIVTHIFPNRRSPRYRSPNYPYVSRVPKLHTLSPATVAPFA